MIKASRHTYTRHQEEEEEMEAEEDNAIEPVAGMISILAVVAWGSRLCDSRGLNYALD